MKPLLLPVLFTVLLSAPSSLQEPEMVHCAQPLYPDYSDRIRLIETHRYGVVDPVDHPEAWVRVIDMSPGPGNGVLVTDNRSHRVDLLIPDEGVAVSYGIGNGAGPGELDRPWAAAYNDRDRIYISEYSNARISVFNIDGDFIEIIRPDHVPGRVVVSNEYDIWVSRTFGPRVDTVDKYDSRSGQLVFTVGGRYDNEDWYGKWNHQAFLAQTNTGVIVSTRFPTDLMEYNSDGVITRILSREHKWLTPPEIDPDLPGGIWNLINGQVRNLATFPNGMIASLMAQRIKPGRNVDPVNNFILDLISPHGEWLFSIPLNGFGRDWWVQTMAVANDGSLWLGYVDDEDIFRIVRYEVELIGVQ